MKRLFATTLAAVLGIALAMPASAAGPARPLSGTASGAVTYPPHDCGPVPVITTTDVVGQMTHLGRMTMHSTHCFAPPNRITGGVETFTAANGDMLFATYAGSTVPDMPSVVGEVVVATFTATISGGTGRFEGATGRLEGKGYITFPGWEAPSWPARFVLAGWITY